jgi:putative tryptophan/tyrosine transport system substrate-binding protein
MIATMKRREFIALLGCAAAWPVAARAQQHKMLRVGFVGMQPRESPLYSNFLKRMAELGYQEGRNLTFDYIQTLNVDGYDKSYQELAARKPDVFLAVGNEPALRAALSAADGKPIAFLAVDFDPLAKGYVANLSHPGGNVTGIFVRQLELAAKRVEIAREAFPRANLIGIAFDTLSREQGEAAAEAARKLGLEPRMVEVKGEQGYADAFGMMDDARGQPIILPTGPTFLRDRAVIAEALLERRIPSVAAFRENMEAGALISYGFDLCSTTSRVMSSGLQGVPSRPTCRSSNRHAFTWRSISRQRHCSVSLCRMCSSLGPTRCANEEARVHQAARRSGRLATRGARAAGRAGAAHRRAHGPARERFRRTGSSRGVPAKFAAAGLERGSEPAGRHPLGYRK